MSNIMFEKMMPGKKYPFLVLNTDRIGPELLRKLLQKNWSFNSFYEVFFS